jgi:hypothetical protein
MAGVRESREVTDSGLALGVRLSGSTRTGEAAQWKTMAGLHATLEQAFVILEEDRENLSATNLLIDLLNQTKYNVSP